MKSIGHAILPSSWPRSGLTLTLFGMGVEIGHIHHCNSLQSLNHTCTGISSLGVDKVLGIYIVTRARKRAG